MGTSEAVGSLFILMFAYPVVHFWSNLACLQVSNAYALGRPHGPVCTNSRLASTHWRVSCIVCHLLPLSAASLSLYPRRRGQSRSTCRRCYWPLSASYGTCCVPPGSTPKVQTRTLKWRRTSKARCSKEPSLSFLLGLALRKSDMPRQVERNPLKQ